jgi:hypothetical protein
MENGQIWDIEHNSHAPASKESRNFIGERRVEVIGNPDFPFQIITRALMRGADGLTDSRQIEYKAALPAFCRWSGFLLLRSTWHLGSLTLCPYYVPTRCSTVLLTSSAKLLEVLFHTLNTGFRPTFSDGLGHFGEKVFRAKAALIGIGKA